MPKQTKKKNTKQKNCIKCYKGSELLLYMTAVIPATQRTSDINDMGT